MHGPPSPPGPANAPPPTPLSERLQSHASYWLTMVYETRPPGGNVLTEERLAYIAEVERKVRAVSGFEDFCHLSLLFGDATRNTQTGACGAVRGRQFEP